MSSNQEKIVDFYKGGGEDGRFRLSRSNYIEFHYTKKIMAEYINKNSNVIEFGCATGNYGMYFADNCCSYTGVDMSPDNILVFNKKIIDENKQNIKAFVGDATNLDDFEDNGFDVVMCLGPMYHLPPEERLKVFSECYRVAQPEAIIAFAYINRLGVYAGACANDNLRNIYPNKKANISVFEDSTDDQKPGVFFFTSPEEMEKDAENNGLKVIKNCGLDFFFMSCAIDEMDDEQFECYIEFADKMSESETCTGLSNHALLICRK